MSSPLDQPLDDDAFVLRGGLMEIGPLARAVHLCEHRFGFFGLSFYGDNGLTVVDIAKAAGPKRLPHPQVRVATVERLRAIDCEAIREGKWPHLTLKFVLRPTDSELEELVSVFDSPIANPLFDE